MPDDQAKEVPQAGKMSFIENLGKVARSKASAVGLGLGLVGGAVAGQLPQQPQPVDHGPGVSRIELATPPDPNSEYGKRLNILKPLSGNEHVLVWPNVLNVDSPDKNPDQNTIDQYRDFLKSILRENITFNSEFNPTFRFFNGEVTAEGADKPLFLDTSGRFKNGEGLSEVIDSIKFFDPAPYHPSTPGGLDSHIIGISKDKLPKNGYVMVFSRPVGPVTDRPPLPIDEERPNAKYDIWELDTAIFSDTAKLNGKDTIFLVVGTQDRTDRLTPFYNKDRPALVQKVVVIFDENGKAVGKFFLGATKFSPRPDFLDTYQGNPSLVNPDYVSPKEGSVVPFSKYIKNPFAVDNEFNGKEFVISIDEDGIRSETQVDYPNRRLVLIYNPTPQRDLRYERAVSGRLPDKYPSELDKFSTLPKGTKITVTSDQYGYLTIKNLVIPK